MLCQSFYVPITYKLKLFWLSVDQVIREKQKMTLEKLTRELCPVFTQSNPSLRSLCFPLGEH